LNGDEAPIFSYTIKEIKLRKGQFFIESLIEFKFVGDERREMVVIDDVGVGLFHNGN